MSSNAETVIAAPEVAAEEVGVESELVKKNENGVVVEEVTHTNGKHALADEEDVAAVQDEEDDVDDGDINDEDEEGDEENGDDENGDDDEEEEQNDEAEAEDCERTNGKVAAAPVDDAENDNGVNGNAKSRKRVNEGEDVGVAVQDSPSQKKQRAEEEQTA